MGGKWSEESGESEEEKAEEEKTDKRWWRETWAKTNADVYAEADKEALTMNKSGVWHMLYPEKKPPPTTS